MNFSDDPLADLLSDNSLDNDNFFDAPSKKSTKSTKSKGKLEDLFGIKEETEADVQSPGLIANRPNASSTPRIVKQKPSLSMDDADDVDLGFDPKRPKSGSGARKNLLDDLLVAAEQPKRNLFDDILGSGDVPKRPATAKPSMSRQSTDTTTDNSNVRPKTSVGPGRRSSASAQSTNLVADPLGLFGRDKETNATVSGMSTPVSKKRGTADWLGLGAGVDAMENALQTAEQEPATEPESEPGPERAATPRTPRQPELALESMAQTVPDATAQRILLMNNLNRESSQSYSALQQQEAQLVIAAQLKSQERALVEMQHTQKAQDQRFQALLQQQLQRQLQMEEHIKAQQERINMHLQLMMSQPIASHMGATEVEQLSAATSAALPVAAPAQEGARDEQQEQLMRLETDAKRNLLEKQRLEELVTNMKINYEQEIELIEGSYKKQLKVMEQHSGAVEERLKLDNSELREYYTGKLEKLKEDYDAQLSGLRQDHEDDLRQLRASHEADMERIRQSAMLEQAALRDHGNYLETLRLASSDLQELREGMGSTREREQQLEARERRLADAERHLKLEGESNEQEKKRLMELVSTLELQLERLSKDSAEENWQLRQRMASLDAEKKALEQERIFHRQQMERDEKRIAEQKTFQLAELERQQLDMQEERNRMLLEKQKLEMQHKLQGQGDLDKERMELEAQLQVARDAIRRADEQRDRCHKLQRELEQRKRTLLDREQALNVKEDEVAQAGSAYRLAMNRCQMAEQKAREAEQLLHAKMQLVGKRTHELSEKEAQLSQERMVLAQDRIALHKTKQQIGQSKCALCKMGVENVEFAHGLAERNRTVDAVRPQEHQSDARPQLGHQAVPATGDIVDRLLDENIEASYRRMYNLAGSTDMDLGYWTTIGLDDDSKKLALDNGNALEIEDLMLLNQNNYSVQ
ncbi:hypothetical protein KR222_011210 [Zaprionus bogoriensis]|nr:hypothetical protein KR222_011210 [Zaprionus bogoriensis]